VPSLPPEPLRAASSGVLTRRSGIPLISTSIGRSMPSWLDDRPCGAPRRVGACREATDNEARTFVVLLAQLASRPSVQIAARAGYGPVRTVRSGRANFDAFDPRSVPRGISDERDNPA
jgi:hypothetical protein